ncbi:serine/threonine-protein kinase [Sorangium sp. So ce185]
MRRSPADRGILGGVLDAASSLFGLREGILFAGRYRLVRQLGAGAMGAVYEVTHMRTEKRCALKVMHPHIVERQDLRDRFAREAKVAASVQSDFIVDVFDADVDEATGVPFLVMELLRGEDLSRRLKRSGRLDPKEAFRYLQHTALALEAMHQASIVHRDLKPGNLFLAERQGGHARIKVLDFGLAKLVIEGTGAGTATTVGTPLYMAPEQFRGGRVAAAADLYALGMIAYALLVGEAYWAEELSEHGNVFAFGLTAMKGPIEPASARAARRGASLPPAFDPWFAQATAVDPACRFSSARAAVTALGAILEADVLTDREGHARGGDRVDSAEACSGPAVSAPETREADGLDTSARAAAMPGDGTLTASRTPSPQPHAPPWSGSSSAAESAAAAPRDQRGRAWRARRWLGAAGLVTVALASAALWWPAASPLAPPDAVLACPVLQASGLDEPAGWLGAAAAATVCERARLLLGGSATRTLVPAELLSLPPHPVDSFPVDPYGQPEARERSLKAAQRRSAAYIDGEIVKETAGFRVSLALRRADGAELGRGAGGGRGLYQAVREAMDAIVGPDLLPKASELAPAVREWSRAPDVDSALALLDLTLAIAHNAGGLPEECSRVAERSAGIAEMGLIERWRCAYILGLPAPELDIPAALDSLSSGALGARARLRHMVLLDDDPKLIELLQQRLEREPSALGQSLLAATASCLLQQSDARLASELALVAVQAEPENPLGEACSPWGQLVATTRDTSSARSVVRAMQAWAPWDGNGWLWDAIGSADASHALTYARRAYVLTPFDGHVASVLADKVLATGEREEVRSVAAALSRGGYPVHQVASDLLLVRVEASEAHFDAALSRARRAMAIRPDDAGWVRVQRFEIAWRALELATLLGHAAEQADRIVEHFLDPEPPPLDGVDLGVPIRLSAVCARASELVSRRCFARFHALRRHFAGSLLPESDKFVEGAERYARGDWRRAAAAWRPLLRQPGMFTAALADAMEDAFERSGDVELVARLESAALAAGAGEMHGALPAHARAARRAAARGDGARARALADRVIDAWSAADVEVPAVGEMRKLLRELP